MTKARSIAIVGGGFGGVGAAAMLSNVGYRDVTVFERHDRVGGVWHQNTYPGAACDVPSNLYEYSFAPKVWSRRYAPQKEIQEYLEDVVREHDLTAKIRNGTEVTSARFDEHRTKWVLDTSGGSFEADVLLAACGQLSIPKFPSIDGLDTFAGPAFHSAEWRHDVDLSGKRVALIGTGCSAIQVVPYVAPIVEQIDVYQRSPGWTIRRMDFAYRERTKKLFARFPVLKRIDRESAMALMEIGAIGMTRRPALLAAFRADCNKQIKKAIKDPELRRKVTPTSEVGCKRLMVTDDWYPTLAKSNVDLVTESIDEVTSTGVVADGVERPTDVLIYATGFETQSLVAPMEVVGVGGRTLQETWGGLPRAYLGLSVAGFPNLFLLYGPNTNGGTGSVIYTIEAGVRHIIAALDALGQANASRIEIRPDAADHFDRELREALRGTVWHTGCANWYVDRDGNDPHQWPWLWHTYRRRTGTLAPDAYALT